jgi:hypothetical protein
MRKEEKFLCSKFDMRKFPQKYGMPRLKKCFNKQINYWENGYIWVKISIKATYLGQNSQVFWDELCFS